jgi:hypothetical protein
MVRGTPDAAREPCVHRKNVLGFRIACEQIWNKDSYEQAVALLPLAVRESTAGLLPIQEWVPETYIVAWAEAVWRGPAQQDEALMRRYVAASIANGFGRVRRFFLQMMTPETMARRAPEIWKQEHTTGRLEAEVIRERTAHVRLFDHPYVETPLMRMALAEAIRFSVSLTRAANVREKHAARGHSLRIEITWDDS